MRSHRAGWTWGSKILCSHWLTPPLSSSLPIKSGLPRLQSVSHGGGFGHPREAGPWGAAGGAALPPPPPPPTSTSTLTIAPTTEAVWIVTHGVGHPSTECTWHIHKRTVGGSPHIPILSPWCSGSSDGTGASDGLRIEVPAGLRIEVPAVEAW